MATDIERAKNLGELLRYEEIRETIKTGDLILFDSKGRVSEVIKHFSKGPYSHVGVVIDERREDGLGLLICESTTMVEEAIDAVTGKEVIKGVQMHWLSNRLSQLRRGAEAWLVRGPYLSPDQEGRFVSWLRQTHAKRTPYDMVQAIGAGIDFWDSLGLRNDPDYSKLFCSELVAFAYQGIGLLHDVNPSETTPVDLAKHPLFRTPGPIRIL